MIITEDQAAKMYALLRPNGGGNQDEIASTVGHRTYAQFVNDAQNEVAARNASLAQQGQELANLNALSSQKDSTINALQTHVAALESQLQNAQQVPVPSPLEVSPTAQPKTVSNTPKLPRLSLWQQLLLAVNKTKVNK